MKCLNPHCQNSDVTRGLCSACYNTVAGLVRTGKITMDELEAAGKIKPSKKTTMDATRKWLTDLVKKD